VVSLTLLWTGKRGKTSKRPRFTKTGQEPNGINLGRAKGEGHSKFRRLQFNNFAI
jgi:hypothetical protein